MYLPLEPSAGDARDDVVIRVAGAQGPVDGESLLHVVSRWWQKP